MRAPARPYDCAAPVLSSSILPNRNHSHIRLCSSHQGHLDILEYLIHAATQPTKKSGTKSAAAIEVEKKRIIDAKDDEGVTCLMKCCEAGEYRIARWVLDNKATAEAKDDEHTWFK